MRANSLKQIGGALAIFMALGFLLAGTMFLLMPNIQKPGGGSFEAYMFSIADNGLFFRLSNIARVLLALAGLGALPAIIELVKNQREGWAVWARNLGYLALAVMVVESLRQGFLVPIEANAYLAVDEGVRAAIGGDNTHITLDPRGWLRFGLLGISILIISILALLPENLPRAWAYLGIFVSLVLWLVVAGNLVGLPILTNGAAILVGIVLGPIWFMWAGLLLRRRVSAN